MLSLLKRFWNTTPLFTYLGLTMQVGALGASVLSWTELPLLLWGAGIGSALIGLDFQRFTGPLQYAAAFVGNTLFALALPYPWEARLLLALPALLLFAVALTVRQRFMHIFTYTRYLWVEPLLLGLGLSLLAFLGWTTGKWPWAAFIVAIPGIVLSGGYIQDAPYIATGATGEYAVKVGDPAPDFELPTTRGETIRLSQFFPNNPVLLLFVRGDWCPGCHMMLRTYERLQRALLRQKCRHLRHRARPLRRQSSHDRAVRCLLPHALRRDLQRHTSVWERLPKCFPPENDGRI